MFVTCFMITKVLQISVAFHVELCHVFSPELMKCNVGYSLFAVSASSESKDRRSGFISLQIKLAFVLVLKGHCGNSTLVICVC